jgi:MFS family permease
VNRIWRTWLALILFAIGTSLITPLIPIYKERLGFGDTVVTLFLVCYVAALVPSMLTLGQLSDRIGRKGVLIGALAALGIAQAYLATGPSLAGLLVARGVQGLAAGAFFGTCTAFLVDAAPAGDRAWVSVLSSISVRGGLGLGPGLGGVFAEYFPAPLRTPFRCTWWRSASPS